MALSTAYSRQKIYLAVRLNAFQERILVDQAVYGDRHFTVNLRPDTGKPLFQGGDEAAHIRRLDLQLSLTPGILIAEARGKNDSRHIFIPYCRSP